jgi:hypothetical protein
MRPATDGGWAGAWGIISLNNRFSPGAIFFYDESVLPHYSAHWSCRRFVAEPNLIRIMTGAERSGGSKNPHSRWQIRKGINTLILYYCP